MMNSHPPTQQNTSFRAVVKQTISDAMMRRLERFMNPPAKEEQEKRPRNNLWLANVAFNVMLAFLDLITAYTVTLFTFWMYGVLVFGAGYGPMLIWEILYVRPYASQNQKWIAIGGTVVGGLSTVGVGILVAILNAVNINNMVGQGTLEIIIMVSLVILAAVHIVLFGFYFFTDRGFVREQTYANSLAQHDEFRRGVKQAKRIGKEMVEIGNELETEDLEGRGILVGSALRGLGFNNLLDDEDHNSPSKR